MAIYDAKVLAFTSFPEIIMSSKIVPFYTVYKSKVLPADQLEKLLQVRYHFIFNLYKVANLIKNVIIRNDRI